MLGGHSGSTAFVRRATAGVVASVMSFLTVMPVRLRGLSWVYRLFCRATQEPGGVGSFSCYS